MSEAEWDLLLAFIAGMFVIWTLKGDHSSKEKNNE